METGWPFRSVASIAKDGSSRVYISCISDNGISEAAGPVHSYLTLKTAEPALSFFRMNIPIEETLPVQGRPVQDVTHFRQAEIAVSHYLSFSPL
jgi:hypothetical protein